MQTAVDFEVIAEVTGWIELESARTLSASAIGIEGQTAGLRVELRGVVAQSILELIVCISSKLLYSHRAQELSVE